jgi:hypothetical protein
MPDNPDFKSRGVTHCRSLKQTATISTLSSPTSPEVSSSCRCTLAPTLQVKQSTTEPKCPNLRQRWSGTDLQSLGRHLSPHLRLEASGLLDTISRHAQSSRISESSMTQWQLKAAVRSGLVVFGKTDSTISWCLAVCEDWRSRKRWRRKYKSSEAGLISDV